MNNTTSISLELQKRVKKAIRMGTHRNEILRRMVDTYAEEFSREEVQREVLNIIENFGNYELIQKVMRSKLVGDTVGKEYRILDPIMRTYTPITRERLKELLDSKIDINDRIYLCKFVYDPYNMRQLYRDSNNEWVYNLYTPPFWQTESFFSNGSIDIETQDEYPDIYKRYLDHLVDSDQKSVEYILDWLANAIQRRNYCILTTIGSQGIGKGSLAAIMEKIFGAENYNETGNRIIAERFNNQIRNKRLVYCDETSVKTQKEEERLKALVNNAVEIEGKGKDAERVTNYASFYFSSNNLDSIRLYADDRRFSIVNLTSTKLIDRFSIPDIESLFETSNIEQFARYLYYRPVDQHQMMRVFISKRTEDIRSAALASWHDWFLDEYAQDHIGKTVKIDIASAAVQDKFGSRTAPGKKAFMDLRDIYPGKLEVFKPKIDGKQVWAIKFPDKDVTNV